MQLRSTSSQKKKVLLMGKYKSGKTSMRSIIFSNYIAMDTRRLGPTNEVEHSHVPLLGNLVLNLWDCGGQDKFMEEYFHGQRDYIFRNCGVLIFVFDVGEFFEDNMETFNRDLKQFESALEALRERSKNASVFILLHKMDLVRDAEVKKRVLAEREEVITRTMNRFFPEAVQGDRKLSCYATSIWDETLYQAWSEIVYKLVPNAKQLENLLDQFRRCCRAQEVVLYEKASFLVISHIARKNLNDVHRFEKISKIVKQYYLSCSKFAAKPQALRFDHEQFTAFIQPFTNSTYIMVIMDGTTEFEPTAVDTNIQSARQLFERYARVP